MLANVKRAKSINAESVINGEIVVYMTASIRDDDISVTKSVIRKDIYKEHIAECSADYDEFETIVEEELDNDTADDNA